MSLIYGYEGPDECGNGSDFNSLKDLVGSKTDDRGDKTVFGKIQKNKEDIASSATGVVTSTSKVIASVVSTVGTKTDNKTANTVFGRIRKNKEAITRVNNYRGSANSLEGESSLKGTQLSHASAITAHSNNLLEL